MSQRSKATCDDPVCFGVNFWATVSIPQRFDWRQDENTGFQGIPFMALLSEQMAYAIAIHDRYSPSVSMFLFSFASSLLGFLV